jgi:hypothetical protein
MKTWRVSGLVAALIGLALFVSSARALCVYNPWSVFGDRYVPEGGKFLPEFDPFIAAKVFVFMGATGMSLTLI